MSKHENAVTVDLTGYDEVMLPGVTALLFGQMVQRTVGVVEHYHSDLFHDAQWVAKHVKGEMSFYWAPRTWGTYIGLDPTLVSHPSEGLVFYRVDVHRKMRDGKPTGMWQATFSQPDPAECELLELPPQRVDARRLMRFLNAQPMGLPINVTYEGITVKAVDAEVRGEQAESIAFFPAGGVGAVVVSRGARVEIDAEVIVP